MGYGGFAALYVSETCETIAGPCVGYIRDLPSCLVAARVAAMDLSDPRGLKHDL